MTRVLPVLFVGLLTVARLPCLAQGVGAASPSADFVAPGPIVPLPAPLVRTVSALREANVAAHLRFLASSSLEGRGLGSKGLEATAEYVAATLALAGVPPAAENGKPPSYFQVVSLLKVSRPSGQLTIADSHVSPRGRRSFSGSHCVFPEIAPGTLAGPVVFAGHGIREPSMGKDDYRGLDVRGTIVVLLGGLPRGAEWQRPEWLERYGAESGRDRYAAKLEQASALGARAVLVIEAPRSAAWTRARAARSPVYFVPAGDARREAPPLVLVDRAVADAVLGVAGAKASAAAGTGSREAPRALERVTLTISIGGDVERFAARNVVGVLPGTNPTLKDEAIVVGAHMDHLGRTGNVIFPGADDNASGVSALLEIAKGLSSIERQPARTIVFTFWTGEEEGHLGSEHYVQHPLWPLPRTRLYVNLDMIGHPWLPEEIRKLVSEASLPGADSFLKAVRPDDFVEAGVAEWATEVPPILERAGRGLGLALHFDRTGGKSGGSDYRAFARKDIPFIRFFGNYFPGYHRPSDTVESLDAGQVAKMARLALATVWLAAEQDTPGSR